MLCASISSTRGMGDADLRMGLDQVVKGEAPLLAELFGIVEAIGDAFGIQHDGSRRYRPGEWSASHLVDARDTDGAIGAGGDFQGKVGHGAVQPQGRARGKGKARRNWQAHKKGRRGGAPSSQVKRPGWLLFHAGPVPRACGARGHPGC